MAFVASYKNIKRKKLKDNKQLGYNLVFDAVLEPISQISKNAGLKPDVILNKCLTLKAGRGFDMSTGKIVSMYEAGIIDPVLVSISALRNAISVSYAILTTGHAVLEI